jgi:hypothetical protein
MIFSVLIILKVFVRTFYIIFYSHTYFSPPFVIVFNTTIFTVGAFLVVPNKHGLIC